MKIHVRTTLVPVYMNCRFGGVGCLKLKKKFNNTHTPHTPIPLTHHTHTKANTHNTKANTHTHTPKQTHTYTTRTHTHQRGVEQVLLPDRNSSTRSHKSSPTHTFMFNQNVRMCIYIVYFHVFLYMYTWCIRRTGDATPVLVSVMCKYLCVCVVV